MVLAWMLISAIGVLTSIKEVLQPYLDKAADAVVKRLDDMIHINDKISDLKIILLQIEDIVRKVQENDIPEAYCQKWLSDIIDIGYEARDVLDDFFTCSSCIAEEGTSTSVKFKTNSLSYIDSLKRYFEIGDSSNNSSELSVELLNKLAEAIAQIKRRLDEKVKESESFMKLKSVAEGVSRSIPVSHSKPETSYFDSKQDLLVGREDLRNEIIKKLREFRNDNRIHVVSIWGMGGVGKTTLAQSIYNDEGIKEDYSSENRYWLFDGEKKFKAKEMIEKILGESCTTLDLVRIQEKLVKKFNGERFFIVLDDVWENCSNEWNSLWKPLTHVGEGGVIIITARNSGVSTAIDTQVRPVSIHLEPLSEKESLDVFEKHAFNDGESEGRQDLKIIGKKIVQKLKGLPLALRVVGHSLRNKRDARIWNNFLQFEEWRLGENDDDLMPVLKHSYKLLPPRLQPCFTYLSVFPKDHVFDKKILVEMWMAHDLIQNVKETDQRRLEDVGAGYFQELVNASLLQCVDGNYVMHDMIHDLALDVSNKEFETMGNANGSLSTDRMAKGRHITIIGDEFFKNLLSSTSKRILTLYTVRYEENTCSYDDILRQVLNHLKSIRVLVLDSPNITVIPDCIGKLRHLRYLDISKTGVKSLPDSLCSLYNLEMLAAPYKVVLPRDIVNMPNLRYLKADLSRFKGVGKLTSLQELSSISVCEDVNISELGGLQQLRGKLAINDLQNVTSPEDAAKALMEEKLHLDELKLEFRGDDDDDLRETTISEQEQVLNALKCPPNLKYLEIARYNGAELPSWIVGKLVSSLRTLKLRKCHKLKFLPPLGEMSSLKHLSLELMDGIEKIGDEFYGNGIDGKIFFPSLESLEFNGMNEWKEWGTIMDRSSAKFFPRLTKLTINHCRSLVSVIPSTDSITNTANVMRSLKRLAIDDCSELRNLTFARCCATTTEDLYIYLTVRKCHKLISISGLVAVKKLCLYDCEMLKSVSTNFQGLDSLEKLVIGNCPLLEPISEESSTSSSSSSTILSSPWSRLMSLDIDNEHIFRQVLEQDLIFPIEIMRIGNFLLVKCLEKH